MRANIAAIAVMGSILLSGCSGSHLKPETFDDCVSDLYPEDVQRECAEDFYKSKQKELSRLQSKAMRASDDIGITLLGESELAFGKYRSLYCTSAIARGPMQGLECNTSLLIQRIITFKQFGSDEIDWSGAFPDR